VLERVGAGHFDCSSLEYVDITKNIEKEMNQPNEASTLCYLLDYSDDIPDSLLKTLGLKKALVKTKTRKIIKEFKEFRNEKRIVKSIKFKTEILMANQN
jgi:hypothetical protein